MQVRARWTEFSKTWKPGTGLERALANEWVLTELGRELSGGRHHAPGPLYTTLREGNVGKRLKAEGR